MSRVAIRTSRNGNAATATAHIHRDLDPNTIARRASVQTAMAQVAERIQPLHDDEVLALALATRDQLADGGPVLIEFGGYLLSLAERELAEAAR